MKQQCKSCGEWLKEGSCYNHLRSCWGKTMTRQEFREKMDHYFRSYDDTKKIRP